jgi:hypothetical protein
VLESTPTTHVAPLHLEPYYRAGVGFGKAFFFVRRKIVISGAHNRIRVHNS